LARPSTQVSAEAGADTALYAGAVCGGRVVVGCLLCPAWWDGPT